MLKRLTILLLEFGAGLACNLLAGAIQQDAWRNLFTPTRIAGAALGAALMLVFIAALESERNLTWNWRWHRIWYLRTLSRNPQIKRWETDFAQLKLMRGRQPIVATEVTVDGERRDMVSLLLATMLGSTTAEQRILVLGEPGSGKTTGLERLTWEIARRGVRRLGWGWRLPVLLRLGNYQTGDLLSFAADEMLHAVGGRSGKLLSRGLPDLLEKGYVVLLCDALDEALGERSNLVLAELDQLLTSQLYRQTPLVITARTREDPGKRLNNIPAFTIQDLSDQAVAACVAVYQRPVQDVQSVLAQLQRAGLLEPGGLGRNPFWLRLVVETGAYEGRKGQILLQAIETLLARELKQKPTAQRTWEPVLPPDEQLTETRSALAWVAYQMSLAGSVALPYEELVHKIIPNWLVVRTDVERLRAADVIGLGRDAQLLIYWPGPVRFRHRLIQEALTAWLLAQDVALQRDAVEQFGSAAGWWETLLMLADLTATPDVLLADTLGEGDDASRLFLAVAMLARMPQVAPIQREQIIASLANRVAGGITPELEAALMELAEVAGDDLVVSLGYLLAHDDDVARQGAVTLLTLLSDDALQSACAALTPEQIARLLAAETRPAIQWLLLHVPALAIEDAAQIVLAQCLPEYRVLFESVLAEQNEPIPGAGVVVEDGQWLPAISWGNSVPAGQYAVGGDGGAWDAFDKQDIDIDLPYQLTRYPITYAQFQCFVVSTAYDDAYWWEGMPESGKDWDGNKYRVRDLATQRFKTWNNPRETVSWYQALAFCRWLHDKIGEEIDLPTEFEWEVAARYAGNGRTDRRVYPWGSDKISAEYANYNETSLRATSAVGQFPRGRQPELDLYDMSGNVWEWCRNKYSDPYDEQVDQSGDSRTLRGGSWVVDDRGCSAACRDLDLPYTRNADLGFRLVVRRPPSHVR